jgi:hypothetical protein
MNTRRDPDRLIHAFLMEGESELADPVYDVVRDRIEQTRQRVVIGPWRMPTLNRIVGFGLAAAAVVAAVLIGAQLLGPPKNNVGGPSNQPTPTPDRNGGATPSLAAWHGLHEGQFVLTGSDDPVQVAVDIASPDWIALPEFNAVSKGDDGLDPPQSVGAALLAWAWPAGTGLNVYGDPCHWSTTLPETPATTPGAIAAALAAQSASDPSTPADVTVGGYAGKAITLHVPMTFDKPNATRDEKFAACDNAVYAFYGIEGATDAERYALGAGQIDQLWILDVNGAIVILDATYGPATPASLVEEIRALAESATFAP